MRNPFLLKQSVFCLCEWTLMQIIIKLSHESLQNINQRSQGHVLLLYCSFFSDVHNSPAIDTCNFHNKKKNSTKKMFWSIAIYKEYVIILWNKHSPGIIAWAPMKQKWGWSIRKPEPESCGLRSLSWKGVRFQATYSKVKRLCLEPQATTHSFTKYLQNGCYPKHSIVRTSSLWYTHCNNLDFKTIMPLRPNVYTYVLLLSMGLHLTSVHYPPDSDK